MNKETIEKKAIQLFNDCIKSRLNVSYLSILNTMYLTACEKNQHEKAHIINELIIEEING